jgi:hypothetical protein
LLEVEPLFDPGKLKNMFKAGRAGATSCTSELMKAVEEMVRKADAPGQEGKIFKFNAEKILGESYQKKFCCSVEVVMKRYRSNDLHGLHAGARTHAARQTSKKREPCTSTMTSIRFGMRSCTFLSIM